MEWSGRVNLLTSYSGKRKNCFLSWHPHPHPHTNSEYMFDCVTAWEWSWKCNGSICFCVISPGRLITIHFVCKCVCSSKTAVHWPCDIVCVCVCWVCGCRFFMFVLERRSIHYQCVTTPPPTPPPPSLSLQRWSTWLTVIKAQRCSAFLSNGSAALWLMC